ncbi:hypothetical protein V8U11_08065 [Pseudomonas chlororaphis]|uniref:hypothetical protein n=1 Tax=Pseudomonas chlororaphis TaxID=587753 RepID=UPI0030D423FB
MDKETEKRIALGLEEKRKIRDQSPSNQALYKQQLLENFPLDLPAPEELFYANTFTDDDEIDYLKGRAIFENKLWNEVNFDSLYHDYVQFVPLSKKGMIYYLPTFLGYFYDMKHPNSEFRQVLMTKICDGFRTSTIDELENWLKTGDKPAVDYSDFEVFNPMQSKLIAMFLVNEANLSPPDSADARDAQVALTSYWGNFLLF